MTELFRDKTENLDLENILKSGPQAVVSQVKPGTIAPIPQQLLKKKPERQPVPQIEEPIMNEDENPYSDGESDESEPVEEEVEEVDTDAILARIEEEKQEKALAQLRDSWVKPSSSQLEVIKKVNANSAPLQVFPVPNWAGDGKTYGFIIKRISYGTWKNLVEAATRIAQSKENANPEEIFMVKIIVKGVAWPEIKETKIQQYPAGIIETLFEAIKRHNLFYDAGQLAQMAYQLK